MLVTYVGVALGGPDRSVAEHPLDRADVLTHLEHMGGERMTHCVWCDSLRQTTTLHRFAKDHPYGIVRDGPIRVSSGK